MKARLIPMSKFELMMMRETAYERNRDVFVKYFEPCGYSKEQIEEMNREFTDQIMFGRFVRATALRSPDKDSH